MHFYVACHQRIWSLLDMCNEMAHLKIFPELRNNSSPNTCNFILLARWKTACIFEKAGFPRHLSTCTCLGIEIQPRYSATVRNDIEV